MAGDWTRMRVELYRDPKVCGMADLLIDPESQLSRFISQLTQRNPNVTRNVMRNAVIGALVSVWGIARVQGKRVVDDLILERMTVSGLDDIADLPGFGEAMKAVGWVIPRRSCLIFPRFFEEHNSDYDQQKAKNRERQARHRAKLKAEKGNADVTLRNALRSDQIREEKSTSERSDGTSNQGSNGNTSGKSKSAADTDQKVSTRPIAAASLKSNAARAFKVCGYHGNDGGIFWQAAALQAIGAISEDELWDSCAATKVGAKHNRPGYFRASLADRMRKRSADLEEALSLVRITPKCPSSAPKDDFS